MNAQEEWAGKVRLVFHDIWTYNGVEDYEKYFIERMKFHGLGPLPANIPATGEEHYKKLWKSMVEEFIDDEKQIKEMAAKFLSKEYLDGDSYGVPGPVDVVEKLADKLTRLTREVERLKAERVGCVLINKDDIESLLPVVDEEANQQQHSPWFFGDEKDRSKTWSDLALRLRASLETVADKPTEKGGD